MKKNILREAGEEEEREQAEGSRSSSTDCSWPAVFHLTSSTARDLVMSSNIALFSSSRNISS